MTAPLADRVREAIAAGFAGTPTELADQLGAKVKAVYDLRRKGLVWTIARGEVVGRKINDWTVLEVAPMRCGQTQWVVRCSCGVVVTRYAADIVAGRSTRCDLDRRTHALLALRRLVRSVPCPTCGEKGACIDVVDPPGAEVRGVTFSYGVHIARAALAGVPPLTLPDEGVPRFVSTVADGEAARAAR